MNTENQLLKKDKKIVLNYIIEYNNEPIDLIYLSNKLCISKRTIQKDITRKELTLELLYDLDNLYGFRDFDWEEFKMNPSLDKRTLKEQYAILKKEKLRLQRKKELFFSKSD